MSLDLEQLTLSLSQARQQSSPQQILDLIPYSSFIGAQAKVLKADSENVLYWLDRRASNIGNPSLPAIHGGVIGGFLELSASIEVLYTLDVNVVPKVVDFSLDYLRPGRYKTIYAQLRKTWRRHWQNCLVDLTRPRHEAAAVGYYPR